MLVAEDGKAYKVTKSVANFWKMCDGSKSLGKLVNFLAEKFNVKPEDVKCLGIKEKISPKRAFRDFIYIIVVILVAAAISPLVNMIENDGGMLTTFITYITLGVILILIYDIRRILYKIIEQRAEFIAEQFAKMLERSKESK